MSIFGKHIRRLREKAELPLRTVSAFLDNDQAILSKIERGQKNATREQVLKLAEYFRVNEKKLMKEWLSDKVVYELRDEELALDALKLAESEIKYKKKTKK